MDDDLDHIFSEEPGEIRERISLNTNNNNISNNNLNKNSEEKISIATNLLGQILNRPERLKPDIPILNPKIISLNSAAFNPDTVANQNTQPSNENIAKRPRKSITEEQSSLPKDDNRNGKNREELSLADENLPNSYEQMYLSQPYIYSEYERLNQSAHEEKRIAELLLHQNEKDDAVKHYLISLSRYLESYVHYETISNNSQDVIDKWKNLIEFSESLAQRIDNNLLHGICDIICAWINEKIISLLMKESCFSKSDKNFNIIFVLKEMIRHKWQKGIATVPHLSMTGLNPYCTVQHLIDSFLKIKF